MKKILTLLAVMAAVLASCNKNEIAPSEKGICANLKLDVTVSYPGEGTKALIKEDWANGDLIRIWYDAILRLIRIWLSSTMAQIGTRKALQQFLPPVAH